MPMSVRKPSPRDFPRDEDWLGAYRTSVDRLRDETAAELGRQPMPPEAFSMIATAVTAVPLTALMLPAVPFDLATWQVALVLALVWSASFRFQLGRYARFQARWDRKVVAHARAVPRVRGDRRFRR